MSKGTIIYIGGFELPDKNAAAHRILSNAKILRDLDYKVVLIDIDKNLPYDSEIINTKKEIQGFENWSAPYPRSNKQWIDYLCNIKLFLEVINRYSDVRTVICYNYQAIAFMRIKNYCNKRNIKIMADCTEWPSTKGTNIIFKIIKEIDTSLRMRIVQKQLDGLIVISRFLEDYYANCTNVIRIPPLVDLSEDKWNISVPEYNDDIIRFVYAGSPGRNKDKLNLIIESLYKIKEFSDYEFRIIGITEEQYLHYYSNHEFIIKEMRNKIFFLGRVSHMESLGYVKNADFTVFLREDSRITRAGFPTKFSESISCGTPIITNFSSDLSEYMVDGVNCISIDMSESNLLETPIKKIMKINREHISKMKLSITNKRTFDYHKYVELFHNLFKG